MTKRIHSVDQRGVYSGVSADVADDYATPAYFVEIATDPAPGGGEVAMAVEGAWINVAAPPLTELFRAVMAEVDATMALVSTSSLPVPLSSSDPADFYSTKPTAQLAIAQLAAVAAKVIADGDGAPGDYNWCPDGLGGTITGFTWPNIAGTAIPKDAPAMVAMAEALGLVNRDLVTAREGWENRAIAARDSDDEAELLAIREEIKVGGWTTYSI